MKSLLIFIILDLTLISRGFSQTTFTFTGNGFWTDSINWSNNVIPPDTLLSGSTIYISPKAGDSCVLNRVQIISDSASLIVTTGAHFQIQGGLIINDTAVIPSVTICSQVWMTKNLDVSTYRNGDPIPQVRNQTTWVNLTTGAWCWYNNDSATYAATYGKLYNWYAVNDPRGLAPTGWHVPSNTEWTTLSTCLGGDVVVLGGAMKEIGTTHWKSPNTGATNSSGFTGLPGGYRNYLGEYHNIGFNGYWWSSTEYSTFQAWGRFLDYNNANVYGSSGNMFFGSSVRCVKD